MSTAEFEAMDAERCIALLPVGATEQHGPHLPVSVDADINAGILSRALELLPNDVPLTCLPPVSYGKSVEHDDFSGTVSLSTNTLIAMWTDIGEAVARAGVKKLIIFNSHGGQPQVMEIVARDLRKRFGMLVVTVSWFGFGLPEGIFEEDELKHGLHAGDVETSIMLHLHPDLVNMERQGKERPVVPCERLAASPQRLCWRARASRRYTQSVTPNDSFTSLRRPTAFNHPSHRTHSADNFVSTGRDMEDTFKYLTPEGGGVGFGWLAQDLNPSGATGDATLATAEKGQLCVVGSSSPLNVTAMDG